MGGNLFKNTSFINKKYVKGTADSFFSEHLSVLGIQRYSFIGSTGKSSVSSDIDMCISCSPLNKTTLAKRLQERLGKNNAKISGQNIAVKYPIIGFPNHFVQIDLMLAEKDKLDDVAWLMSGDTDGGVKGVYRNLLLCHIAKKVSNQMPEDEKITISFPGGLQHKKLNGKKWVGIKQKFTNPDKILKTLGIKEEAKNLITYKQLVDAMLENSTFSKYLDDFPEYIDNYIKRDPSQANKALWYIKTKIRLKNERGNS